MKQEKNIRLQEIAERLNGELRGEGDILISNVASLKDASAGDISILAHRRYLKDLQLTHASAVVLPRDLSFDRLPSIHVDNPYYAFSLLLHMFFDKPYKPKGVDSRAVIGNDVQMGMDVTVYPFVYIDDGASIGDGVTIYPWSFIGQNTSVGEQSVIYSNVTIREGCKIGCRVIIHSGAVIGSDGFGFVPHQGKYCKIPQVGGVFVEDDVEIGANTTIDRGTIGSTIVRRGAKIDNLIQIAHNVSVGEDCILAAQSGIAGSTELGHHVTVAGQAGVTGHIRVGDHVTIAGQSGVTKDVADGETVSGMPAFSHRDWLRAMAVFEGLPELKRKVNDIDKKLKNMLGNK